jgi:hypothetical protein
VEDHGAGVGHQQLLRKSFPVGSGLFAPAKLMHNFLQQQCLHGHASATVRLAFTVPLVTAKTDPMLSIGRLRKSNDARAEVHN